MASWFWLKPNIKKISTYKMLNIKNSCKFKHLGVGKTQILDYQAFLQAFRAL